MKNQKRIERLLAKYAPLLGGTDENGKEYKFKANEIDAKQLQHIFWLKNRDEDNAAGAFVRGNVIKDKIRDDYYEIDYIGHVKDSNVRRRTVPDGVNIVYEWIDDDDLNKDEREFKKKFQKYCKLQEEQLEAAEKNRLAARGEFVG